MNNQLTFLFVFKFEIRKFADILNIEHEFEKFIPPFHLFRQDVFGQPTTSLCGIDRATIGEMTKVSKTMPRYLDICEECKTKYQKTPLYAAWVKNVIPDRQRSMERTRAPRRSSK